MNWLIYGLVLFVGCKFVYGDVFCCNDKREVSSWESSWRRVFPSTSSWSLESRIPMTPEFDHEEDEARHRNKLKLKKKYKQFLLPLLLAYKLKFFTLIPVLIGGLILLTGATGLAGFFFALFAAVMGIKGSGHH